MFQNRLRVSFDIWRQVRVAMFDRTFVQFQQSWRIIKKWFCKQSHYESSSKIITEAVPIQTVLSGWYEP